MLTSPQFWSQPTNKTWKLSSLASNKFRMSVTRLQIGYVLAKAPTFPPPSPMFFAWDLVTVSCTDPSKSYECVLVCSRWPEEKNYRIFYDTCMCFIVLTDTWRLVHCMRQTLNCSRPLKAGSEYRRTWHHTFIYRRAAVWWSLYALNLIRLDSNKIAVGIYHVMHYNTS
jgi:hypothetical protein